MRTIHIGHSPDADDIFMYYAIAFGWVGNTLHFCNQALDIQTLNLAALKGEFDISAISFALYPLIFKQQALLRTGVSFGEGYGPKLIKLKNKSLKKSFKVALSGEHTTNALLFKIAYPQAKIIYKNFLEIEKAVLEGEVDAGVLIHESILTYDEKLEVECEIWDIWCDLNRQNLPLPLGGMCLRRSIPLNVAIECEEILTKAVQVALNNKALLSQMLLERNLIRVDAKKLECYLNLYANAHSVTLSPIQLQALEVLFKIGFDKGFYPESFEITDCLIPTNYQILRNQ